MRSTAIAVLVVIVASGAVASGQEPGGRQGRGDGGAGGRGRGAGAVILEQAPTDHTIPEQSLPPAWKSSGSPARWRSAITSTGVPSAAQTLL